MMSDTFPNVSAQHNGFCRGIDPFGELNLRPGKRRFSDLAVCWHEKWEIGEVSESAFFSATTGAISMKPGSN